MYPQLYSQSEESLLVCNVLPSQMGWCYCSSQARLSRLEHVFVEVWHLTWLHLCSWICGEV